MISGPDQNFILQKIFFRISDEPVHNSKGQRERERERRERAKLHKFRNLPSHTIDTRERKNNPK